MKYQQLDSESKKWRDISPHEYVKGLRQAFIQKRMTSLSGDLYVTTTKAQFRVLKKCGDI